MNKYQVTLKYPKVSRLPIYLETVDAATQSEAKLIATTNANKQGWKAKPMKLDAVIWSAGAC